MKVNPSGGGGDRGSPIPPQFMENGDIFRNWFAGLSLATMAYVVHPHEIAAGVIYKDANVTVTAFPVKHGTWDESWGYRFDTPDKSIVISGDTAPTETVAKNCHGCDLLIHEVYSQAGLLTNLPERREYHRQFHTSTAELAKIAAEAKPKTLVLYHVLF